VLTAPGFLEQARARGEQLRGGLRDLAERHPVIAEVRGPGLMVGVELLRGGRPDAMRAAAVVRHCREVGRLLLMTAGSDSNVVRWMPPLIVSESEVASGLASFDAALAATASSAATA
jgi:4-aminobutyrate aminotransferase